MTDGEDLAAKLAEARRMLASGQPAQAWQAVSDLLRQFPDDPRIALEAGLIALRNGRSQDAVTLLRRATERQPDSAEAWSMLGEALIMLGHFAQALPALAQAGQRKSLNGRLLCLRGMAQQRTGDRDGAVASFRDAVSLEPDNSRITAVAGVALAELGARGDALAALTRAAAVPDAPFSARACLAGLQLLETGFDSARGAFAAAVDVMTGHLQAGRWDQALLAERQLDQWFVRPIEAEDHAETCFARWRDAMTQAGAKAAVTFPPAPPETAPARKDGDAPIVGFFLHTASMLGHVELTLDYLAAIKASATPVLDPRLYVFSGTDAALRQEAERRGLPVTFVETEGPKGASTRPYQKLLWLRERLARDGAEALVWVSVPHFVHFGAALGLAPVNIFWALRFRPVASPYVQGSIACASCFEREDWVNGRRWNVVPLAFRDLAGPPRQTEAEAIRRSLGSPPIIFGTLARGEKMQGAAWLEAVGRSLRACPQALFLWTGRTEDPQMAGALREMGVAAQSRFIGWVDTRLYAQVLDIFLDTAPVGCGMTAMEAMAWGKPLVSFKDPLTNWGQCLRPVLDGRVADPQAKEVIESLFALGSDRELLAWADTPQDYAALVARLAADTEFRADVGAAGQAFTARYFGTPDYAAARLATAIRDTIVRVQG